MSELSEKAQKKHTTEYFDIKQTKNKDETAVHIG